MALSASVWAVLLATLKENQTLLMLLAGDPSDPDNAKRITLQYNYNKAIIKATEAWEIKAPKHKEKKI